MLVLSIIVNLKYRRYGFWWHDVLTKFYEDRSAVTKGAYSGTCRSRLGNLSPNRLSAMARWQQLLTRWFCLLFTIKNETGLDLVNWIRPFLSIAWRPELERERERRNGFYILVEVKMSMFVFCVAKSFVFINIYIRIFQKRTILRLLQPWRLKQYVSAKRWSLSTSLHGVVIQKTNFDVLNVVYTKFVS